VPIPMLSLRKFTIPPGVTRRDPNAALLVPGEMERQFEQDYGTAGILLPAQTLDDIRTTGLDLGLDAAVLAAL